MRRRRRRRRTAEISVISPNLSSLLDCRDRVHGGMNIARLYIIEIEEMRVNFNKIIWFAMFLVFVPEGGWAQRFNMPSTLAC
jgi:hypothetical protein